MSVLMRYLVRSAAALAALSGVAVHAAHVSYVSDGPRLGRYDSGASEAQFVASFFEGTRSSSIQDIALDSTGALLGVARVSGQSRLYAVNSGTGELNFHGVVRTDTSNLNGIINLAFSPSDDLLAIASTGTTIDDPFGLYSVDPLSGLSTLIGEIGSTSDDYAQAFDLAYANGTLYAILDGINGAQDALFKIDPLTAALTLIGSSLLDEDGNARNFSGDLGLGTSAEGALLLFSDAIYEIDAQAGTIKTVGALPDTGLSAMIGAASPQPARDPVPVSAPSTLSAILLALAVLWSRRQLLA